MVTYTYKVLSQVFETQENSEMRDMCLKNGTFLRFIERIGQLTSEKKRTKVEKVQTTGDQIAQTKVEESTDKKKKKNLIEQDKNKVRKGVGYTTGVGTAWNVSEYLKSKESKNQ